MKSMDYWEMLPMVIMCWSFVVALVLVLIAAAIAVFSELFLAIRKDWKKGGEQ